MEEHDALFQGAMIKESVIGVPAHLQDTEVGFDLEGSGSQLVPFEAWHDHICEKEVNMAREIPEDSESLVTALGNKDLIPGPRKDPLRQVQDHGFVLHQKDGLPRPVEDSLWRGILQSLDGGRGLREVDAEYGTEAGPRVQEYATIALLDDPVDGGQSEARTLSDFFGGEERLEDPLLVFLRDPHP